MRTAIDTNVFSSIWSGESTATALRRKLNTARSEGALLVCPAVFAELHAYPGATVAFLRQMVNDLGLFIDYQIDARVWSEAGQRYAAYSARRRAATGEFPRRLLTDFLLGSHALLQSDRLLTLDAGIYRRNFPELALL